MITIFLSIFLICGPEAIKIPFKRCVPVFLGEYGLSTNSGLLILFSSMIQRQSFIEKIISGRCSNIWPGKIFSGKKISTLISFLLSWLFKSESFFVISFLMFE